MAALSDSATGSFGQEKQGAAYRALKAAVIILGVLMVLALVILVVGLALRFGSRGAGGNSSVPAELTLAPGAKLVSMDVSADRLVLRLRTPSGDEVDIVDTGTGRLVGRVKSAPAPH